MPSVPRIHASPDPQRTRLLRTVAADSNLATLRDLDRLIADVLRIRADVAVNSRRIAQVGGAR